MAQHISDDSVFSTILALVREQQHLYGQADLSDHDLLRLEAIKVELDQGWNVLRMRDARREFGLDPEEPRQMSVSAVERYDL